SSAMRSFCSTTSLKASATLPATPVQSTGRRTPLRPCRNALSADSSAVISARLPDAFACSSTAMTNSTADARTQPRPGPGKNADGDSVEGEPEAGTKVGGAPRSTKAKITGISAICNEEMCRAIEIRDLSACKLQFHHSHLTTHSPCPVSDGNGRWQGLFL